MDLRAKKIHEHKLKRLAKRRAERALQRSKDEYASSFTVRPRK